MSNSVVTIWNCVWLMLAFQFVLNSDIYCEKITVKIPYKKFSLLFYDFFI